MTEERLREIEEKIPKVGLFSKATVKELVTALREEQVKTNSLMEDVYELMKELLLYKNPRCVTNIVEEEKKDG